MVSDTSLTVFKNSKRLTSHALVQLAILVILEVSVLELEEISEIL